MSLEFMRNYVFDPHSLHVSFYAVMLVGAIYGLISNGKESGVFRFVLLILFFAQIIRFGMPVHMNYFDYTEVVGEGDWGWVYWVTVLKTIFWAILSLIYYKHFDVKYDSGEDLEKAVIASNKTRVIHFVFDGLLSVVVCSNFVIGWFGLILRPLKATFGELVFFLSIFILSRSLYYIFYEMFFRTTPVKMLTSCFVGRDEICVNELGVGIGVKRALTRMVPFQGVFCIGDGKCLHDSWTGTRLLFDKSKRFFCP